LVGSSNAPPALLASICAAALKLQQFCRHLAFHPTTIREAKKPPFHATKMLAESLFLRASESGFGRLEKQKKNPICSMTCRYGLYARRIAPFVAEIAESAPGFAPLIRDILEGLT
jgi:hypothetical protein